MKSLYQLYDIVSNTLDSTKGCEWLRSRTPSDIAQYTIDETYELADAIRCGTDSDVLDELADLAFHLVYYATALKNFSLEAIFERASQKLTARLAHDDTETASASHAAWHKKKQQLKPRTMSTLSGIPLSLPALSRSQQIQNRVAAVGFDWTNTEDVILKLDEEVAEFKAAYQSGVQSEMKEELGDILFTLVNLCRHTLSHAEEVMHAANDKFSRRFEAVESKAGMSGRQLEDMSFDELLVFWSDVKKSM